MIVISLAWVFFASILIGQNYERLLVLFDIVN
jgi:hypothetical protein